MHPQEPSPKSCPWFLAPWLALALAACGGEPDAPDPFPIPYPLTFERDFDRNLEEVRQLEGGALGAFLESAQRQEARPLLGFLAADFVGRFPGPAHGRVLSDEQQEMWELQGDQVEYQNGEQFAAAFLDHVRPWRRMERGSLGIQQLRLVPSDDGPSPRAVGIARLELGGSLPRGGRCHLRVRLSFEALRNGAGNWTLARVDVSQGTRSRGPVPHFRSVAMETGFDEHISQANRSLVQSFVDEQRTLALGGLAALDWNDDGFWDLLSTRRGQLSTLFLNDGAGGFVPETLPVDAPKEAAAFLLHVDLDGDGIEELVNSEVLSYEGERAFCGLYSRGTGFWSLNAKAFEFENPVGLRRLAVQTVVPLDANGDGLLDLFFAVYGSAESRRELYNSVESHDGADNHLFINQGNLVFTEESAARGIAGTQYTYVATAFDFDEDGDQDLFEGNDFGPNILWLNDGQGQFTADTQLGIANDSAYSMGATLADYDNTGHWSLYVSNMSSDAGSRMVDLPSALDPDMRERVRIIASGNRLFEQQDANTWLERAIPAGCNEAGWAWGSVFCDLDNDGDQDLFVTGGFTSHSVQGLPDWQPWYWRQVLDDAQALQDGRRVQDANSALGSFRGSFNGYERDRYFLNPDGAQGRFIESGYLAGLDASHDGRAAIPVDMDGDGDLDLALWTLQGLRLMENQSPPANFARVVLEGQGGIVGTLGALVEVDAGGVTRRQVHRLVEGFQSQVPGDLHFGLGTETQLTAVRVRWPSGKTDSWSELPAGKRLRLREGQADAIVEDLPAWPAAARARGTAPRSDTFAKRLGGGSGPLSKSGSPTVLHLPAKGEAWSDSAKLARGFKGLHLVQLLPADETSAAETPGDIPSFLLDEDLSQRLFGAGEVTRPATFLFDSEGALVRAFRRPVKTLEILAILALLGDESTFPELLVEAGRRALAEGRFREGRELFQGAVVAEIQRPDAYDGLARAHRMLGRPDLAEESYRRAVQVDPDYALGHYNLGTALAQRKAYGEAVESYLEALRVRPSDVRSRLALGEIFLLQDSLGPATDVFRDALSYLPQDADRERSQVLTTIGKLLGRQERYAEAAEALLQALALDEENGEAQHSLERVQDLLGTAGE